MVLSSLYLRQVYDFVNKSLDYQNGEDIFSVNNQNLIVCLKSPLSDESHAASNSPLRSLHLPLNQIIEPTTSQFFYFTIDYTLKTMLLSMLHWVVSLFGMFYAYGR